MPQETRESEDTQRATEDNHCSCIKVRFLSKQIRRCLYCERNITRLENKLNEKRMLEFAFLCYVLCHVVIVLRRSKNIYNAENKSTKKFIFFSHGGVLTHILIFIPRSSTSVNKKTAQNVKLFLIQPQTGVKKRDFRYQNKRRINRELRTDRIASRSLLKASTSVLTSIVPTFLCIILCMLLVSDFTQRRKQRASLMTSPVSTTPLADSYLTGMICITRNQSLLNSLLSLAVEYESRRAAWILSFSRSSKISNKFP